MTEHFHLAQDRTEKLSKRLLTIWQALIEPAREIQGIEERRQAKLLASMLIIILPLIIVVGIIMMPILSGSAVLWQGATFFPALAAIVTTIIAYVLNRIGQYRLAAGIYIVMFIAAPLAAVAADTSPQNMPIATLMVGGVILASVFFPAGKVPLLAALGTGVGVLSLLVLVPGTTFRDIAAVFSANLTNSILILIFAHYRNLLERDRQAELKSLYVALKQSEKHFRSLIENALDIITILDGDGTIRFESPSIEQVLGYKQEELVGQKFFGFVHPDDLPDVMKTFTERSQIAGPTPPLELRFWHKDGSWRVLEVIGSNLLEDPAMAGIVINSRDITERKQLEEQFRQAQRMEAIGQLTAGIAHDFNNLLTAMNGFAGLMQLELSPDDPHQDSLDRILHSGQRAADLVRQLLVFSRKQVIEPQVLSLNSTVNELDKMLRRIIGEDIRLESKLAPDLWNIKFDQSQIEQVIVNLAVNARDAMPDGGRLTIETANVLLDDDYVTHHLETQTGEHVLLAISDTGLGMSEEVKAHIFEPFFTTKEQGKGTGLGLATVYGIVKQNGGHIWVYSEPGVGTTFKIYLPRTGNKSTSPIHIEVGTEMPSGNETILLVEDDTEVRTLVQKVLQTQGYTLLEAKESQEALQLAIHHRGSIDLLLTDVIMPGMNGRLLAEKLVQMRPDLKILFMSGYTDNAIAHHGVLDPGVFLLQKPFGPTVLARKVRHVLDS